MVFKGKRRTSKIRDWQEEFQQTVNKAAGNQHLQFIAEKWMKEENSPNPEKQVSVQILTNNKFPFLDMKMSWSPEGDLKLGLFRKNGKQLKYVGKGITHRPGTLHAIPLGVLNRLDKITSRQPSIHSEGVDKIYPDHVNALRKAGLVPPNFLTMGDLWRKQDTKVDMEK